MEIFYEEKVFYFETNLFKFKVNLSSNYANDYSLGCLKNGFENLREFFSVLKNIEKKFVPIVYFFFSH